jgi:hypothetical protein
MTNTPVYRYFTADLITGQIVMEVPFQGVTWEKKVNAAGSFSGQIAAEQYTDAFDLYNSTLPGKNALYIMRNNVCVWGGIIWSRSYEITEKRLSIQGSEFVSYLFHRTFWKSFTTDAYQAVNNSTDPTPVTGNTQTIKAFLETLITAVSNDQDGLEEDDLSYGASDVHCRLNQYRKSSSTATITSEEPHGFTVGDSVVIYIGDGAVPAEYSGTKTITGTPDEREFQFAVSAGTTTITDISATATTYAILSSTNNLLQTQSDVRMTTDIDDALADYVTFAYGDNNPFTFRGTDGRYVGEIIQRFANDGVPSKPITADADTDPDISTRFDFTVESVFDTDTQTFNNVFKAWLVKKDINNPTQGEDVAKDLSQLYGSSSGRTANTLIFEHPGNISSMSLEESAETSATRTWVIDSENDLEGGSAKYYGSYTNIPYLQGANYPIIENIITGRNLNVSGDEQVAKHAKELGYKISPPVGVFRVSVNGSLQPEVSTYVPGDWCIIVPNDEFINKRLAPPYENRLGLIVRKIKGYSVSVPDFPAFPEVVSLELIPEWDDV